MVVFGLYSQPIQPLYPAFFGASNTFRIVDLTGARLIAARIVGELNMGNQRLVTFIRCNQLATCPLLMVEIVPDEPGCCCPLRR